MFRIIFVYNRVVNRGSERTRTSFSRFARTFIQSPLDQAVGFAQCQPLSTAEFLLATSARAVDDDLMKIHKRCIIPEEVKLERARPNSPL